MPIINVSLKLNITDFFMYEKVGFDIQSPRYNYSDRTFTAVS